MKRWNHHPAPLPADEPDVSTAASRVPLKMSTWQTLSRSETSATAAQRSFARLAVFMFAAYVAVAVVLYVWRGASFTPDRWLILLLIGAAVMGKAVAFLRDWIPLVMLIAGYELMRKLAGTMVAEQGRYVHVQELIAADRALFGGQLPTLWLQDRFYDAGQVHWYDYVTLLFYALHFVFPLAFAFMLWVAHRERFWQFCVGFLLMTYAAFAFFLFYPAAPPWFAERYGYLKGVAWPAAQSMQAMVPEGYQNFDSFKVWDDVSGNPVAAMPSLHAAFPWLVLLFAVKYFGLRGLWFLPYSPILWFSIVYLAHHWVIDIVAGVAWATLCFVAVQFAWPFLVDGRGWRWRWRSVRGRGATRLGPLGLPPEESGGVISAPVRARRQST